MSESDKLHFIGTIFVLVGLSINIFSSPILGWIPIYIGIGLIYKSTQLEYYYDWDDKGLKFTKYFLIIASIVLMQITMFKLLYMVNSI